MRHERKLSYQRVAQSDSTGTNLQVYGRYVRKLHRELESPGFLQDFFLLLFLVFPDLLPFASLLTFLQQVPSVRFASFEPRKLLLRRVEDLCVLLDHAIEISVKRMRWTKEIEFKVAAFPDR